MSGQGVARPGLGIYLAIPDDQGAVADVLISATSSDFASVIQAEAHLWCLQGTLRPP
jgi:hypothetical protein